MRNTRKINIQMLLYFITVSSFAQLKSVDWPVLKTYDQDHIQQIAMPVGGIGTGTIS